MCLVENGQDGNRLLLENVWQIFFKFLLVSQVKSVKTDFGNFFYQNSFDFVSVVV